MKRLLVISRIAVAVLPIVIAIAVGAGSATAASSHRSWCHSNHTCPSDHHTYAVGRGLYCTSYADERLTTDTRTVSYDARRYWCGRKASGTLGLPAARLRAEVSSLLPGRLPRPERIGL